MGVGLDDQRGWHVEVDTCSSLRCGRGDSGGDHFGQVNGAWMDGQLTGLEAREVQQLVMHAPPIARDENLRRIRAVGRAQWKRESGYHQRSLAETGMFREKTIFGEKLSSRDFENQATEAFIRCAALNRMTQLGMPQSYPV